MTTIDRRYSVAEGTAIKAPCRVATTVNITLGGLQVVDGVTVAEHDRVLVKNQTDQTLNGIYEASTGNWQRTKDFDGARDIVQGTRIDVVLGTVGGSRTYAVATVDPIVIGTSNITFTSPNVLAGPPGISGGTTQFFATRTQAIGTAIDTGLTRISVDRYAVGRPLVSAIYIPGTSAGPAAFRDNGGIGNWWELDISSGVIDATWFGVSGVGDNGPALNAAIAALPTGDNGGGRILLPPGDSTFSTPINLDGKVNIIFEGTGSQTSGGDTGTKLRYTGTGSGDAISMRGINRGCGFRNMKIAYNNPAFTGNLINIGNGAAASNAFQYFENLVIADDGGAHLACLVYLGGGSQVVSFSRVTFNGGKPSVRGKDAANNDHFANVVSFRDCTFLGHSGPAVLYGGVSWTFENCAIEPEATGASIFYRGDPTVPAQGVVFDNCFIGDATAPGEWIFFYGTGLIVTGGTIGADHSGSQYGVVLHAATGCEITGVTFGSLTAAVSFDNTAVDATVVAANTFIGCDQEIASFTSRGGAVVCEANTPRSALDPAVGSATWDPPNLASGAQQTTSVTAPGAVVGDRVEVSFSNGDLANCILTGAVVAVDTVTVVQFNNSGVAVNGSTGILKVRVTKW